MNPRPKLALFFKSHVDTYTRKDGVTVQAHDDKRQAKAPEIGKFMSDAGYKSAKKTHESRGKINGWDHVIDPLYGHHKLMTKYNVVGFDSEHEAHEFAKHNKAKTNGYWGEEGHDGTIKGAAQAKDWRDEENWHSRTMAKMKTHSEDQLRFIHKDATEAAEVGEKSGFDSKKTGQYRDEAHYAAMELKSRQDERNHAGFQEQKERAVDDLRKWANKEHGQYGSDWIRKNGGQYLQQRWGIGAKHAEAALKEWFPSEPEQMAAIKAKKGAA